MTADRLTLFRLMAKQIAKQVGLMATFMPKPYTEAWGSGAHFNMSLTDVESGRTCSGTPRTAVGRGWSKTAYGFAAGILRHAPALAAICTPDGQLLQAPASPGCPTARSRGRRPGPPTATTTARACCGCRATDPRIENRGVDSAANPYLAAAFLLAAGLEGVAEGLDPGDPVEDLTYDWAATGPVGAATCRPTRLPAQPARGDRGVRRRPAHPRGLPRASSCPPTST